MLKAAAIAGVSLSALVLCFSYSANAQQMTDTATPQRSGGTMQVAASDSIEAEKLRWERDFALWQQVEKDHVVEEYNAYLHMFPTGEFAEIAKERIKQLTAKKFESSTPSAAQPTKKASADDEAMFMTEMEALEIQARLTSIGYDTGSIDGVLGRHTRRAIFTWQRDNQLPMSGFISFEQMESLSSQSEAHYTEWLSEHGHENSRLRLLVEKQNAQRSN
nr:peptidoglycan-binding domain-containing protein [uncultured Cohaesibacter sp.]